VVKKTENHMKAPKCASFVAQMRNVFTNAEVTVVYVRENDVAIGEKPQDEAATCNLSE
jgi:hypothetical protein